MKEQTIDFTWLADADWSEVAPWDRFDPYLCSKGETVVDTWQQFNVKKPRLKEADRSEGLARRNLLGVRRTKAS